jgi:hypothetical protein
MPSLFDRVDGLKSFARYVKNAWRARGNKRREPVRQDKRKRIDRSSRCVVIVVGVHQSRSVPFSTGTAHFKQVIEVRVNQPGMIVILSRAVPRMDMLKGRQKESQQQRKARL